METITFRPLARSDLPRVVSWLAHPHVSEWWGSPVDEPAAEAKYGPRIDGTDPVPVHIIELGGAPIGMIQSYPLDAFPRYSAAIGTADGVGLDLLIGEPDLIGRGIGPAAIEGYLDRVAPSLHPGARTYVAGPSVRNARSVRAFEKAGFQRLRVVDVPDAREPEQLMVRDVRAGGAPAPAAAPAAAPREPHSGT